MSADESLEYLGLPGRAWVSRPWGNGALARPYPRPIAKLAQSQRRHDPDQALPLDFHQKRRMAPLSTIEVAALALLVLGLALITFVLFSILATS
jgi:hypothetical protein